MAKTKKVTEALTPAQQQLLDACKPLFVEAQEWYATYAEEQVKRFMDWVTLEHKHRIIASNWNVKATNELVVWVNVSEFSWYDFGIVLHVLVNYLCVLGFLLLWFHNSGTSLDIFYIFKT